MAGIKEGQPIFPRYKVFEGGLTDEPSLHDHLLSGHWCSLVQFLFQALQANIFTAPLMPNLGNVVLTVTGCLAQKLVWPFLSSPILTQLFSCLHHSKNHKTKLLSSSQGFLVLLVSYSLIVCLPFDSHIQFLALPSLLGTLERFIWGWNRGKGAKSVASKIIPLLS